MKEERTIIIKENENAEEIEAYEEKIIKLLAEIFTFLMITGIIGAVLAFTIYRLGKKNREQAI